MVKYFFNFNWNRNYIEINGKLVFFLVLGYDNTQITQVQHIAHVENLQQFSSYPLQPIPHNQHSQHVQNGYYKQQNENSIAKTANNTVENNNKAEKNNEKNEKVESIKLPSPIKEMLSIATKEQAKKNTTEQSITPDNKN